MNSRDVTRAEAAALGLTVYGASSLKRTRRTRTEMTTFRRDVWDLCAANQPLSARQCYYRAVVAGLVEKDTGTSRKNEAKVGDALDVMRERSIDANLYNEYGGYNCTRDELRDQLILPFTWLTDSTRARYQAELYGSKEDALRDMATYYRRDLWRMQPAHVEVWCESESIAGMLMNTTDTYSVALLPCRGQSGKRFVWDSAQSYKRLGKPVICLYVGDFDPNGLDIGNSVRERLARYGAPDVEFTRIAVQPAQIVSMGLPGHGLNPNIAEKTRDRFTAICDEHGIPREAVEAEAMPPDVLRNLISDAIDARIDQRQWELEQAVEEEERRSLEMLGGEAA